MLRYIIMTGMALGALGCDAPSEPLRVDLRYSEYLSVLSREYESAARTNAATTVQVVQVFSGTQSEGASVRDATSGRLVYEARLPSDIVALFESIQSRNASGVCELGKGPAFVLVAYDRDVPRVGVIRLYKCESDGGAVLGIRPAGDAALIYSSAGVAYLQQIGVW